MSDAAPLIDSHCHLTFGELGKDPDGAIERARCAGVSGMIVIGTNAANSAEMADFVAHRDGLWAAVGIHPTETAKADDADLERIRELLDGEAVVALGESGLDFYWDDSPPATQERWLERHVELALDRDLPLVLHIRDAYSRAAELLEGAAAEGLRGIVHCFGGEAEEVVPFVEWGWPISFSGILTYPKADNVRGAAKRTPLDQCLIETDAPWLTPHQERGRTNEPAFVRHVVRELARVKGVTEEEASAATRRNTIGAFGLPVAREP